MDAKLAKRTFSMLEELVTEKLDFVEEQFKQHGDIDYVSCEMTFMLLKVAELRIVIEELSEELNKTKRFIKGHVKN
jgi:uncharacterized protein YlbG (UPF0298 family)